MAAARSGRRSSAAIQTTAPPPRRSGLQAAAARTRTTPIPSLVAAASVQGTEGAWAPPTGLAASWQDQAWAYFHSLGIVKYSSWFYGKSLSRVRLVPGILGEDGRPTASVDDEGPAEGVIESEVDEVNGLIRALRSPLGGQPALLRSFGINLFVAGECRLFGRAEGGRGEIWDVLSTDELRRRADGTYDRIGGPKGNERINPKDDDVQIIRVWQPDERFKRQADSSLRGVLDICEELVLLNRELRAESLSRLPNGILAMSDELEYAPVRTVSAAEVAEGDIPPDDEDEDPFVTDLIEAAMTSIRDKGSAAALIPLIVRGTTDAVERGIKHILLSRPESARTLLKRREAVEMYAMGVDLPVEVVLGHQQTTFSNAFQVDEDTYKVHILPMLEIVADALTVGYLWPRLAARRGLPVDQPLPDDITQHVVYWDATHLVTPPDRSAQATEGLKLFAIGSPAWRRVNGFGDADAMDDDEKLERVNRTRLENTRETIREQTTSPDDALPSLEPGVGQPGEPIKAVAASGAPDPIARLADRLAAAADVSIDRAIDRLGSRLRNMARKNGHSAIVDGVPNGDVAITLGPTVTSALLDTAGETMFIGDFSALCRRAAEWAAEAGLTDPADFASRTVAAAETVAERRLYGDTRMTSEMFLSLVAESRVLTSVRS